MDQQWFVIMKILGGIAAFFLLIVIVCLCCGLMQKVQPGVIHPTTNHQQLQPLNQRMVGCLDTSLLDSTTQLAGPGVVTPGEYMARRGEKEDEDRLAHMQGVAGYAPVPQHHPPQGPQSGFVMQPLYPKQQPGFSSQEPGYPHQQSGFPSQEPGYPHQQIGFPTQEPGYPHQQAGFPTQAPGYPHQQAGFPTQEPGYPHQQAVFPSQ